MIAPDTLLQNRYLVVRQIGQGGMGAVYLATDQRFGSTVALKETFFTDPNMRKAFEREARLLNHLRHSALPKVIDHFIEAEGQFLVMEYIAGDDLAEKLHKRGGAFPLSEVLNWADQLLDALDYLHTQEQPVIHRDIKPQNLKLTPRNHIVLLDFGLAKGTPSLQVSKVTATGSVFGYSRNYAPLEQIQGTGTDPRSDLYSLAATLYHLITGTPPPDALTRATAVLNGQPDPLHLASEVHAQVTPAVAQLLNQAMAQNAGQRPPSAAAMREALREAARQDSSETRATKPLLAAPSTNLYEQETQLIYAATPATTNPDVAEKTGAAQATGGATVAGNFSEAIASSPGTRAESDSVLTKVATEAPQANGQARRRVFAIALVAAACAALVAVAYSFMRPTQPKTPARIDNVQSAPPALQTPSPENQESAETVNEDEQSVAADPTPAPAPRHTPVKSGKEKPTGAPPDERVQVGEPSTPDPPDVPAPQQRPERQRQPPVNNTELERTMREAEEQRRAAQEQRRNAIIRQRIITEMERRRRQRARQP